MNLQKRVIKSITIAMLIFGTMIIMAACSMTKRVFLGKKPTGKPVHFFAIDVLHINDGKIVEDWHLEDNVTLLQQLGAIAEN